MIFANTGSRWRPREREQLFKRHEFTAWGGSNYLAPALIPRLPYLEYRAIRPFPVQGRHGEMFRNLEGDRTAARVEM